MLKPILTPCSYVSLRTPAFVKIALFCSLQPDPNLTVEEYTRSFDQDEELGLNDIDTDAYVTAPEGEEEGKTHRQGKEEQEEPAKTTSSNNNNAQSSATTSSTSTSPASAFSSPSSSSTGAASGSSSSTQK